MIWQDLGLLRAWQSQSAVHGVDGPGGDLNTSELHAVKTACDLDKS